MQNMQVYNFALIFKFAEDNYGIGWNDANDVFFGNSLDYGKHSEVYPGDWSAYIDLEAEPKSKALDYTKEEVLAMDKADQSYIIVSAYFESLTENVDDTVLVDCT